MNEKKFIATLQSTYFGDRNAFNLCLKEWKKQKQALNEIKEYILGTYEMKTYTKSVCLDEENIEDILEIIKKVSEEE